MFYINISFSVFYVVVITVCLIIQFATFPGYGSEPTWCNQVYFPTERAVLSLWFVLNVICTPITIYALMKILRVAQQAGTIKVNKATFLTHMMLAISETITIAIYVFSVLGGIHVTINVYTTWTYVEFLTELLICYIVWTAGASAQLKRFKCTIWYKADGSSYFEVTSKCQTETDDLVVETISSNDSINLEGENEYKRMLERQSASYIISQQCD